MIIESKFKTPWWLKNSHLQTLWSSLFRQNRPINTSNQRLELDDGDFIDLEWLIDETSQAQDPVLLLLHGLEGSIDSVYIQNFLHKSMSKQWKIAVMQFRSCSRESNRLPISYHSGKTGDLIIVLDVIKKQYPESMIMAAGFSLGGNMLLKYLGENGKQSLIDIAAAISVPFLLHKTSLRMDRGFSRFYRNRLLGELKRKARNKIARHSVDYPVSISALDRISNFYDFDDQVTAPLHGFKSADDYYQSCSSRQFISSITKPTLILHAADDPFMTEDVIPEETELAPLVTLELSQNGGHVGFISGNLPWLSYCYIDRRIPAWLQEQLDIRLKNKCQTNT